MREIEGNEKILDLLLEQEGNLVPFIGAGFSVPACPLWSDFLDFFFNDVKGDYFLPEDEKKFLELKESDCANKFELMADFLIEKCKRGRFEDEIKRQFDKPLQPGMGKKFKLLHKAFPGLKITTNFDCLIERNSFGEHVEICRGDHFIDLNRLLSHFDKNSLLKIHGGLRDIHSIVLTAGQYAKIYGHDNDFSLDAALPKFLTELFKHKNVLFIGCSLVKDRLVSVLKNVRDIRPQFAVMKQPKKRKDRVSLLRHLGELRIKTIWINEFSQIEDLLEMLIDQKGFPKKETIFKHDFPFVGRETELEAIGKQIQESTGSVQLISGHLFNLEGAGGVGKTTLAVEVARQFGGKSHFPDGVLELIRIDEHTPQSFVVYLARQFDLIVDEPPDEKQAQQLINTILKNRRALIILDNAIKWQNLRFMLPDRTRSVILVTTRDREIYNHLRLSFEDLSVQPIRLEKFTERETLQLFSRMLDKGYQKDDEPIYLGIAGSLGFLPLALRQAISLMLFAPRYTVLQLRDKLILEDRLHLLQKGRAAEGSDIQAIEVTFDLSSHLLKPELTEILELMAVCAPGAVPVNFLRLLASESEAIEENLERLFALSWCECRQMEECRAYELHQLVRDVVLSRFGSRFQDKFFEVVHGFFLNDEIHFSEKDRLIFQLHEALRIGVTTSDRRLIEWLYDLYDFCAYRGHAEFYIRVTEHIEKLFPDDKRTIGTVYSYRALILQAWGRLSEAMELHQKEEKICEELGDRAGLAACYGNQALILKAMINERCGLLYAYQSTKI